MFPIKSSLKDGDALTPLLFNFVLDYAIRRVHVNQDGLKLNGTHKLLVYADEVIILGRRVHTINKYAEALVVASKETGRKVTVDKSKHIAMSQDPNALGSHNIKIYNSSLKELNISNIWEQH